MYWSDWGSSPKIEKANMDGSARTTLVSSVLIWVNSLAMGYQNRLLYWCDAGLDTIERVDLQGNNRVLILDLSLDSTHPFGLALFGDALFWSDWHNQSVHSYNMTTSRKEVVFRGMGEPMDLHIYDQAKDFFGSTSCSQLNGGCSHLCLPNPHGHQCFCPEGVQLKPGDNYTCQGVNRCPQLSAPAHGSLAPCANLPGHYCHFSCDSGYTLAGSATRTCHNNGVWTGTQPQCNALSCASLTTPQNAILLTISCGITIGSNCVFGCQDGYGSSQGNVTRTCLQTGQWSGDPISCTAHSCGPVNIPPGATLLTASCGNTYGSSCVLGCQSDNFTTTCLQSGQWSGNPINCTDNSPPSFNNTCPDNMVFYATECSSSALLTWIEPKATDNSDRVSIIYPAIRPPVNLTIGLYNVLYSATDSNGNQANCTFIVQVARKSCPVLQPPVYGSISSLSCGSAFGSQASLACNKGYRMAGAPLRSCRADGIWSGNVTSCNIVKCPQITTPPHGMVFPSACQIPSGVNYKTECFFVCNVTVGFQLEGASKVSCLESGSWSEDTSKTICRDTQAPSITCPPDMDNIPTEPGKSYADVKWQLPVLNDNSNKNLTLTGSRPPLKLDVGKKHITYKVTDSSGLSRSCIFFIHVKDLEPPKIANCPDGIYKTSEEKWTKIFFPGVTVTDNVGVHLLTTDRQNGSMFTWGEHNVTYTASDIAGNTAKCHFQVIIVAKSCDELRTPQNGAKACDKWLDAGTFCTLHCNVGYDFVNRPPEMYICGASGKWVPGNTVPDCSKTRPAQTLLALEYHYLSDKCTEEIHNSIAGNFIALYTTYLGTVGGCDENEECTIENVGVECGDQSGTLRKRDIADSEQASKVPLTVKFALKVPLPSNTSVVGLNEATQQISSNILASLSEADLTLNVSGVILEYDSSKPPVVRTVGLVCDKGQVLKGTHCVNCPVGYFFSSTGCQACAEDNYQDNEAQIECVTCPSGTSTFGQTGSKGNEDCQEIRSSSSTGKQGMPAKILYPVIALVSVLVIAVTVFAIYCLRKRRRDNRRPTVNARTQNHGMSENVQHDNPTYGQASSEPEYMEIDSYQRPVPQPDVGFRNPHFDPGDNYQTLDNANERPDHTYGRLDITGVRSQSYV